MSVSYFTYLDRRIAVSARYSTNAAASHVATDVFVDGEGIATCNGHITENEAKFIVRGWLEDQRVNRVDEQGATA